MKGVSVVICCYNSAERLPATLDFLSQQNVDNSIPWEVIIIDNNSTDTTAQVAKQLWKGYSTITPLLIVEENKSGLSYARSKGILSSSYDYIIFCDDDNWLSDNYVNSSFHFFERNKDVGILGGLGDAAFGSEPPSWFTIFKHDYAVGSQNECSADVTNSRGYVYGAGMVLRKSAWIKLNDLGFQSLLSDRKGNSLSSGGDTELCYALRMIGYKIYYSEDVRFRHYIPHQRLSVEYLYKLQKAFVQSRTILFLYDLEMNVLTRKGLWFREIFYFLRTDFFKSLIHFASSAKVTEKHVYYHNRLYFYWRLLKSRKAFYSACQGVRTFKNQIRNVAG